MSVSLLRLMDGRIMFMFLEKSQIRGKDSVDSKNDEGLGIDCRPWVCFSSDEGKSWTEPMDVARYINVYIVVNNDRIVQLKSGRLIIPASIPHLVPVEKDGRHGGGDGVCRPVPQRHARGEESAHHLYHIRPSVQAGSHVVGREADFVHKDDGDSPRHGRENGKIWRIS